MRSVRGTARRLTCYGSTKLKPRRLEPAAIRGGNDDATNQAAFPRRRSRQPAAHRAGQAGARQARERRDHRRPAQRGRGPRDREDHQEAGRGRPQARHRRRIPPLLVAFRFLRHARRRRNLRTRPRHPIPGRADQAAQHQGHRQDRLLQSPDDRALQVPEGAHQGDAENVHPGAEPYAFPARARRGGEIAPMPTATPSSTISPWPIRTRSRRSTPPAAAICSSTTPPGPISARKRN